MCINGKDRKVPHAQIFRKDWNKHVGQLVPAINLSDRGLEENICMEFNGSG